MTTQTQTTSGKATARPWHTNEYGFSDGLYDADLKTEDGITVAHLRAAEQDELRANATLIVRAVNQYDALIKHCNELNEFANHFESIVTDANFKSACGLVPELESIAEHLAAIINQQSKGKQNECNGL